MSVLAPLLLACFLFAVQGFLLQTAVALTGDPAPGYGRALVTWIVAAIVSVLGGAAWSCTFGLLLALVSQPLATLFSLVVGLSLVAAVYRRRLGMSGAHALVVAGLHGLMFSALSAVLWALLGYVG